MLNRLPLYIGGFLGPFGTIVIIPMYPELRAEFAATSAQVNLGFSLYLLPMAVLLLFSGTLGERWGRRRTVQTTYVVYAVCSLLVALAPNLWIFVGARMLQGVANAFITPLLIAGLAELVPPDRLGREVGIYSSFQALGGGLGPVVGGIAADTAWQGAFIGTAAVAAVLALFPPEGAARQIDAQLRIRPLLTPRMLTLGAAFFLLAAGPIGVGVLVGIAGRDVFDLSGTAIGAILFAGSLAAMLLSPQWGRLVDQFGQRRTALIGVSAATVLCAALSFTTGGLSLLVIWVAMSSATALSVVVFQAVGATVLPANRGGALSFLMAWRFVGHAVGPIVLVPVLERSLMASFGIAAALGVVALGLVARGVPAQRSDTVNGKLD